MRVERLNQDKIRIFLTFDDLMERGIEKDDMWRDIPKVHELFNDMMNQAQDEVGFTVNGPVAVEVFSLPAQGMVVIVTRGKTEVHDDMDDMDYDDIYEMQVTLEESEDIVYVFQDFEHLIALAHRVNAKLIDGGSAYAYNGRYYLVFEEIDLPRDEYNDFIALLSEYGEASTLTKHVLQEYGKVIVDGDAVKVFCRYFS
ncbi:MULTISPECIES: genetic competence negative regulator [Aneurinibacillus]|uniref:Adapter protein MecA n=1 Tax=Aneurinibacillus thermoaerophilus TaxID=143495 RepID=A0A1G7XJW2_ANETH|nr:MULTISPECIES: genetic competence negative regulator [Aneurinibacillus]AMA73608.1 adaptor protein [Aneurinibacillus sp. XH2]MED0675001.1 genetic competence negative regulator [Aneurinibacillus thermoaerophilus]MED0679598.1 genetic competence negative regulator [Aneurinibacillus thermoaerophilus]MED0737404.1 genetic competence negative regulator [Aneurinibacillus thermoaerophilus]MED0756253.1 genetic competence negative regulator [Aneurinibacillus thermoaerophilus]